MAVGAHPPLEEELLDEELDELLDELLLEDDEEPVPGPQLSV